MWSYNLDSRQWQRLLRFSPLLPADVLAATYDYTRQRLLVLDELRVQDVPGVGVDDIGGPPSPIGPGKQTKGNGNIDQLSKLRYARLVVHDLQAESSYLVAQWKRSKKYDRLAMVLRDDGSFVLLATHSTAQVTFAFLGAEAAGTVKWLGTSVLHGSLVFQPRLTERGVVVPILGAGALRLAELNDGDFHPSAGGIEGL